MKHKMTVLHTLGVLLGYLSAYFDLGLLALITLPLEYTLKSLALLSLKSDFMNILAWVILILVSSIPAIILYSVNRKFDDVMIGYVILSIFIFVLNILTLHPQEFNGMFTYIKTLHISLIYLLAGLGIVIEHYFTKSKTDQIIVIFLYLSFISYGINLSYSFLTFTPFRIISLLLTFVLSYLNIKLSYSLIKFLNNSQHTIFKDQTLLELNILRSLALKCLKLSIYGTLVTSIFEFIGIYTNHSVNFTLNIPLMTIVLNLFINLYITMMDKAVFVQKENELFI